MMVPPLNNKHALMRATQQRILKAMPPRNASPTPQQPCQPNSRSYRKRQSRRATRRSPMAKYSSRGEPRVIRRISQRILDARDLLRQSRGLQVRAYCHHPNTHLKLLLWCLLPPISQQVAHLSSLLKRSPTVNPSQQSAQLIMQLASEALQALRLTSNLRRAPGQIFLKHK